MSIYVGTQFGASKPVGYNDIVQKVEDYVKHNPPLFAYNKISSIELYFTPYNNVLSVCSVSTYKGKHNATVKVGTEGELYAFTLAHELAHAYAPVSEVYYYVNSNLPHDEQPCELYADSVAEAVTGITRQQWKAANGLE